MDRRGEVSGGAAGRSVRLFFLVNYAADVNTYFFNRHSCHFFYVFFYFFQNIRSNRRDINSEFHVNIYFNRNFTFGHFYAHSPVSVLSAEKT